MATRKLTAELEIETSKAKSKLKELESGRGGGGGSLSPAADKAAKSLENAAKGADQLSKGSKMSADQLRTVATTFAGLGIRMATASVAANMEQGSAAQPAVSVGGSAIAGALQGSVAGPLGAIAGGILGLTTSLIEASSAASKAERERQEALLASTQANREQLEALWESEKRTKDFKESLDALMSTTDENERKTKLQEAIEKKRAELDQKDSEVFGTTNHFASANAEEANEAFKKAMGERMDMKGELEQMESLLKTMQTKEEMEEKFRASNAATDALSRIGGGFTGMRLDEKTLEEAVKQRELLDKIERNTKNGGATWL